MAPPDKIGRIGTVKITYRAGHSGPVMVAGMSEYDFERLQTLVTAYVEHATAVDKLNNHPNRKTRNQVLGMLGLPLQEAHPHMESREYDFPTYRVSGRRKRATSSQTVRLSPKHIRSVEYVNPIDVSN